MSVDPADAATLVVILLLLGSGYFIIRDWYVTPSRQHPLAWQMIPYFVVFTILGFAFPAFWAASTLVVALCLVGHIGNKLYPPPVFRPFSLPDPIGMVTCKIQREGMKAKRVKAELLPPAEQPNH